MDCGEGRLQGLGRFVLAAAVALALVLAALVPASADAAPTGERLRAGLNEVMAAPGSPPGLSVYVKRPGRAQFLTRGVANVANGAKPTRRQHYRIASMSKAFNGAVALTLVRRGKLNLDDTVGELLPGLLPLAEDVTLGQALHHTGSLPEYIRDPDFLAALNSDPTQYMTPEELVGFVADTEPEDDPGQIYEYSDTDNVVVGLMAEAVSERPYDELLEGLVYRRTGLQDTSLPETIEMPEPYLHGYELPDDPLSSDAPEDVSEVMNPALAWASGGIVSTVRDVARFFQAYVGGNLFGKAQRHAQRRWVVGSSSPSGPGRNRAGLGLFRYKTHCGTMLGHTGSFPGYRVFAAASSNGKRVVVFTVNSQIVPPDQGSQEVADLIRHAQLDAVCHALR